MARILPVASGKGGVGKTLVSANLGVALARRGKSVVLVDLDLGGSNLHTCLGIKNTQPGIGALIAKKTRTLEGLAVGTGVERLSLVPGDNLMPGAANIEFFVKNRIIKDVKALSADYAILDLGAGASYNVVDFFLLVYDGFLVVKPEITSVLNAYSFLKSCVYRLLYRAFPKAGPERERIRSFVADRIEGSGSTFLDLARELARDFPDRATAALEHVSRFEPRVVANQASAMEEAGLFRKLREVVARNLGTGLRFESFLPDDPYVPVSVAERQPLVVSRPDEAFSRAAFALADKTIVTDNGEAGRAEPRLYDDDLEAEAARAFLDNVESSVDDEEPVADRSLA